MKISSDALKIQTSDRDLAGEKVEPEEKPVRRVIQTTAPLSPHGQPGAVKGSIPTEVVMDAGTIGDLARGVRRMCLQCKHFDQKNWQQAVRRIEKTSDVHKRQEVNSIRAALLMTKNAQLSHSFETEEGDLDVEVALMVIGKCRAISDAADDLYLTFPQGCCPDAALHSNGTEIQIVTPTTPNGYFQPASRESKKEQSKIYDQLLKTAAGKTP